MRGLCCLVPPSHLGPQDLVLCLQAIGSQDIAVPAGGPVSE